MNATITMDIYQPELFKLLSNCFILPNDSLIESVVALEYLIGKVYPQLADDASDLLRAIESIESVEQLQVEFTRLFIGPYTMLAPPYESLYRNGEGTIMGESTMEVLQLYKDAGFDLAQDYFDAPDHIATELEFLYVLFAKTTASRFYGDSEPAEHLEDLLKSLLIDHLGHWIPELTNRIETKTESTFYKSLAKITRKAILHESRCYLDS